MTHFFNKCWLSIYPRPELVRYNNGGEFMKDFKTICKTYGLKRKKTTVKNPRANSMIERAHQVFGTMLRTFDLDNKVLDPIDPFGEYLAQITWAMRSTYHTTLDASPGQIVFGRDMLIDMEHQVDWKKIHMRKQKVIDYNNLRENSKRFDYDYKQGDKVLIHKDDLDIIRKAELKHEGPF